jgi:DNA-binding SARP family transcriptional activator
MLFTLLGPLRVDAGAGAAPGGARLRVLLAALLLQANTPVAAEALAEAVWDGSPPTGAADTLRSYVQRLRRTLGPEAGARIVTRAPGYLMNVSESELDVRRFETLCQQASSLFGAGAWDQAAATAARALDLWRGAPLLDVPSQCLRDAFVPRLERLRVQAIEERIEADLHLGRHESLVPGLYDVLAEYPLHERLHAQLMLALSRSGRQAEALEVYRETRRVLIEELGVEPGAKLRAVHAQILSGEVESAAAEPEQVQAKRVVTAAAPRQLPAAPRNFTGRHAELDAMLKLIGPRRRVRAPGGAAVVSAINGMAGIGKTALQYFPEGILGEFGA